MINWLQKYHADFLNGEGLREVIFLAGCNHGCKGCFNKESWNFKQGNPWTEKDFQELKEELKKDYISGVTFTGGDPMYSLTINLLEQLSELKKQGINFDIWVYTGFTFDEILERNKEFLNYIDVLCDGPFIKELHQNNKKKWVGSSNQRVIDVKKTLQEGKIVEIEDLYK